MVAVADTSPLNYLILIDEIGLLPGLYRRILVPKAVLAEMVHPDARHLSPVGRRSLPPG
jgi:predicted nucleic acid-binding protein